MSTLRGSRALRRALDDVLSVLLPQACAACDRPTGGNDDGGVCAPCWASVEYVAGPSCPRCGRPHADLEDDELDGVACGACMNRPPPFAAGLSLGLHRGPLRTLIHQLKFRGRIDLAAPLARRAALLLEDRWHDLGQPDCVVPVPLPALRRLRRGYNQSELIASALARHLGLPVLRALRRRARGRPQADLPAAGRRRNVRGAFRLGRRPEVAGRSVLLVDDVWTTGETLRECCRILHTGGARRVAAFSVARAPEDFDLGRSGGLD